MINPVKNLTGYHRKDLAPFEIFGRRYFGVGFEPSVILGLAFGNTQAPCTQNLGIAVDDARFLYGYTTPVIAQKAILDNCTFNGWKGFWSVDSRTKGSAPLEAKLNSRQALEIAREITDIEGFNPHQALYIAHPAHMERVIKLAERLGFKGQPFVEAYPDWNSEIKDATQNPRKWKTYELKARLHHILKGWV